MTKLEKVLAFATKAHEGQKRKFNDEPYVNHSIRIANRLLTQEEKVVALLHDVFEDTPYVFSEFKQMNSTSEGFSLNSDEIWALEVITKLKDETYLDYLKRFKNHYSALPTKVKIEDLKDNLSDLPLGTQRDKYELALYILQGK